MILIFSVPSDVETDHICGILKQRGSNFIRINDSDFITGIFKVEILNSTIAICTKKGKIKFDEITCVWIRKLGFFRNSINLIEYNKIEVIEILNFLKKEYYSLIDFIINSIDDNCFFNNKTLTKINKLIILKYAKELGIKIPPTIITNNKSDLVDFVVKHNCDNLIIKPITENFGFIYANEECSVSNFILSSKEINQKISNQFFLSQFQKYIEKLIEIRCFYLEGKLYSMAIFSQQDEKTKIDFRNYNFEKPNRFCPYKLPVKIEKKLIKLFQLIGANVASADLILTNSSEFYFLEINPFGIFSMIEERCNFGLYELVAESLIKHSNEVKKQNSGML